MPNDSSARPFAVGDVVAGKYRIERVLGEGGMGIVAAATHLHLQQLVAIKFVHPAMLESKVVVERFMREARAAVRLKSEHAARVIDVDVLASGVPYMVMEYLEGSDLSQVLRTAGRLAPDLVADYVVQACEAVAEAHARGIVHRDLKPQNLFLTKRLDGTPFIKVLDFGISKMADDFTSGLTNPQVMMGSPQYMAPEQMRGSTGVDARADIWALGVVLYRLLANALPFGNGPMPEICLRVMTESPRPLAEAFPDVPEALVAVVERCLQKDPAARFQAAGELASALEPLAPPSAAVPAKRARAADAGRASMLSIPPPVGGPEEAAPGEAVVVTPRPQPVNVNESAHVEKRPTPSSSSLAPSAAPKRSWGAGRSPALFVMAVLLLAVIAVVSRRASLARQVSEAARQGIVAAAAPPAASTPVVPPLATTVVPVTAASVEATSSLPVAATPPVNDPAPQRSPGALPQPSARAVELAPVAAAPPAHARTAPPHAVERPTPAAVPPKPAATDDDIPSLR